MTNKNQMNIQLNNSDSGQSFISTPLIKGRLDCIIVDSNKKIDILIESSWGYIILERSQSEGITYYSPRNTVVIVDGHPRDVLTHDMFNLNENLKITITAKNTMTNIILRWRI